MFERTDGRPGRPPKREEDKHQLYVKIYVTEAEKELLIEGARCAGLGLSEYCRTQTLAAAALAAAMAASKTDPKLNGIQWQPPLDRRKEERRRFNQETSTNQRVRERRNSDQRSRSNNRRNNDQAVYG
jgi:hypothetical protein